MINFKQTKTIVLCSCTGAHLGFFLRGGRLPPKQRSGSIAAGIDSLSVRDRVHVYSNQGGVMVALMKLLKNGERSEPRNFSELTIK